MRLDQLMIHLDISCSLTTSIQGLCLDSRKLQLGDLFFAYPGTQSDGRDFMQIAADAGAAAILYDPFQLTQELPKQCPCIAVPNLQSHISHMAHRYANEPSEHITVIGITGTNGKTSVSHYLAQALNACEQPCAVMGTLGVGISPELNTTGMTTPDAITCVEQLAHCLKKGASHLAMEVSSHALSQHRAAGLRMPIGVFTNLSQDHLDYHGNLENYAAAKAMLWQQRDMQTAVINWDDETGKAWIESGLPVPHCIAYSCDSDASIPVPAVQFAHDNTLKTPWGSMAFKHSLIGGFNDANVLAVIAVLGSLGVALNDIETLLPHIKAVPGRMESMMTPNNIRVVIDYAHTPDALEKALLALRPSTEKKLACVFGCGGNRDQSKRPIMGEIASKLSDSVIITNDNPRHENPQDIADAILAGASQNNTTIMLDREKAIQHAIQTASSGDTILVAGKGHETTQIIGDKKIVFSDQKVVVKIR